MRKVDGWQTANALRTHMAELGIVAGAGMASVAKLLVALRDEKDNRVPDAIAWSDVAIYSIEFHWLRGTTIFLGAL